MFSWFLKLLGINEDRPAASNNSLLNTTPAQAEKTPTPAAEKSEPEAVSEPEPEPTPEVEEKVKEEPAAARPVISETISKTRQEEKPEEPENLKQATKTAPEPEPEAETKSLTDEFPGLKANFVKVLTEAGFDSRKAIEKATDKELLAVKGIGQATVKILRS